MKEYHIVFAYRPGTDTKIPEHLFVELEDETGKSISVGAWVGNPRKPGAGGLVSLVLPNYEEDRAKLIELSRQVVRAANGLRGYIMDDGSTSFFRALGGLRAEIEEMQPEDVT